MLFHERENNSVRTVYHQPVGLARPKRGDLVQTNIGSQRERTWFVLAAHILPTRPAPAHWSSSWGTLAQRTQLWAVRWWELEPEMRMALFRSAERAGGQITHPFQRFPPKRKPTFERYLRRSIP